MVHIAVKQPKRYIMMLYPTNWFLNYNRVLLARPGWQAGQKVVSGPGHLPTRSPKGRQRGHSYKNIYKKQSGLHVVTYKLLLLQDNKHKYDNYHIAKLLLSSLILQKNKRKQLFYPMRLRATV
jgi:hypothetical protein